MLTSIGACYGQGNFEKGLNFKNNFQFDSAEFYFTNYLQETNSSDSILFGMLERVVCKAFRLNIIEAKNELDSIELTYVDRFAEDSTAYYYFLISKGHIHTLLNDHDLALQLLLKADSYFNNQQHEYHDRISTLGFIAYNFQLVENLEIANPYFQNYQQLIVQKYSNLSGASAVYNLYMGMIHHFAGELILSDSLLNHAINIAKQLARPEHFLPLFYRWLASSVFNQYTVLDTFVSNRIKIHYRNLNNSLKMADSEYELGNIYTMLGRYYSIINQVDTASYYFEKAIHSMYEAIPITTDEHLNIYGEYGRMYNDNHQSEEASKILDKAIQILENYPQKTHFSVEGLSSEVYFQAAVTYSKLDNPRKAIENIQKTLFVHNFYPLDSISNLLLPDYNRIAKYREALEYLAFKVQIMWDLYQQDKNAIILDTIIQNGITFDSLFEYIYTYLDYEWSKQQLQRIVFNTYGTLVDALYLAGERAEKALGYSEKTRAVRLKETLASQNETNTTEGLFNTVNSERLSSSTPIFEFFTSKDWLYRFVIHNGSIAFTKVGEKSEILSDVEYIYKQTRSFQNYLGNDINDYNEYCRSYKQKSYLLYQKLFDTIIPEKRTVIIPQSFLCYLPFELLLTDTSGHDWDLSYLIKSTDILYKPFLSNRSEIEKIRINKVFIGHASNQKTPIPYGQNEIQNIEAHFPCESFKLTENQIKKYQASPSNIFHITSHAKIQPDGFAYIQSDGYEGEWIAFPDGSLNTHLVVLSACETGTGNIEKGEGLISMAYNCLRHGAHATVSSLWEVDDYRTAQISKEFYRELKNKHTLSNALAQAKRSYLKKSKGHLKHPYYWASLVLLGGDSEISTGLKPYYSWLILGLFGLFFGVFLILKLKSSDLPII